LIFFTAEVDCSFPFALWCGAEQIKAKGDKHLCGENHEKKMFFSQRKIFV
jgi:hypothetical protein